MFSVSRRAARGVAPAQVRALVSLPCPCCAFHPNRVEIFGWHCAEGKERRNRERGLRNRPRGENAIFTLCIFLALEDDEGVASVPLAGLLLGFRIFVVRAVVNEPYL